MVSSKRNPMRINDTIPDFKVTAFHNGEFKTVTREDLRGKWAILMVADSFRLAIRFANSCMQLI